MPPIDRYGSTRPDRTPLFVGLGLLLLALVGWTVWAMSDRDTADYAAVTTVTTASERDVALEAQRRSVTETRSETTRPLAVPTAEVVEQPPTTGPNGVVSVDPVAPPVASSETADRSAAEVSLDAPAVPSGTGDGADLEAFVTDVRDDLTALRREMTELRTRPGETLDAAQQEQLRGLEKRLHDLEQRVNSLQSAGAAELEPLEEEIRTALLELEQDFDDLTEVGSRSSQ